MEKIKIKTTRNFLVLKQTNKQKETNKSAGTEEYKEQTQKKESMKLNSDLLKLSSHRRKTK